MAGADAGGGVWFVNLPLSDFLSEARPMFAAHSAEVGEASAEFDEGMLRQLEDAGAALATLAFQGTVLVGYLVWYLAESSLERKGLRSASQGPWFLASSARGGGVGAGMMRWSLGELRARGFDVAFPHRWERSPLALASLFESLGAKPLEHTWALDLKEMI